MTKFKTWISAARLRTLPLSISGIFVGTAIAANQEAFNIGIFSLALATTLGLQILSNFANDYGDFTKGTDNEERVGPMRALQSGIISKKEMFYGMLITAILTFFLASSLIYIAVGSEHIFYILFYLFLGIAAIAAAIKYTIGDSAYGYKGLGDIFVFLFFGIVGVYGCYFLYTLDWDWIVLFPAFTIGFLSAGVLNLNNIRDRSADEKANKHTLVVKIGIEKAKNYHYLLIIAAVSFLILYSAFTFKEANDLLYLFAFYPLLTHLMRVMGNRNPELLDPELKKLALRTFLLAVLFSIGQVI